MNAANASAQPMSIVVVGGGMITNDQILPSLYHLQRLGRVGPLSICALGSGPLRELAHSARLAEAFPGQSFAPWPALDTPPERSFPDLYIEAIAALPPRQMVVVAVPDPLHYPIIKAALEHDQHVLTVKPLVLEHAQAEEIRKISSLINVSYVRQGEPLGLGHAVLVTRHLVGDEPFAVILADDVMDSDPPALRQMIDVYTRADGPVIAVERVPHEDVSSYGIVAVEPAPEFGPRVHRIVDLVEKPKREDAPSNLAIIGRYILTPDIFPALEQTAEDRTGEIQLTNGMRRLLQSRPLYACEVEGVRHDTGNKLGFLKAVVYFALKRRDLSGPFRDYLAGLDLK